MAKPRKDAGNRLQATSRRASSAAQAPETGSDAPLITIRRSEKRSLSAERRWIAGFRITLPAHVDDISALRAKYGVIGYTHPGGVDRPLATWKGTGSTSGVVVVPHLNWRGLFGKGTDQDGYASTAEIEWPGFQTTASHARAPAQMPTRAWFGGVLEGMRDAGGTMYMRNRYYDPATGQFTQTDPIGIAGGLNTYGFANGDPVTYSDPYGLCGLAGAAVSVVGGESALFPMLKAHDGPITLVVQYPSSGTVTTPKPVGANSAIPGDHWRS